jgi:hypothetical protein
MMREAAGILGARWDKVPERQRPHYAPEERFRILRIRSFLGLSQRETAEMFRVSTETIARWEIEATATDREVARPLVATDPPVRRFADVVRMLVKTMELAGAAGAGEGLDGSASREGTTPESRLDGGSDGRERAVRDGTAAARVGSKSCLRGRTPGENVGRCVRARRHRSGRRAGLCAPTPTAIPIAPLHDLLSHGRRGRWRARRQHRSQRSKAE